MIFNWIEITNFGSYRSTTRIDLKPEDGKIVTLIGGRNGAGKSTLLEAIKCCLYGKRSRGLRSRDKDYEKYLMKRKNYMEEEGDLTKIELSFTFYNKGEMEEYTVSRSWFVKMGKLEKSFNILKNGFRLSLIKKEEYQDFLINLIPPHVLDLYLFDAEDIESITIEESGSKLIKDTVKMILGLNFADQLLTDLDEQIKRIGKEENKDENDEFKSIEEALKKKEEEKEKCYEKIGKVNQKIAILQKKQRSNEEAFNAVGGKFAVDREKNLNEKNELSESLGSIEGQFFQIASANLPFAIGKSRLEKLLITLDGEREKQGVSEFQKILEKKIKEKKIDSVKKKKLKSLLEDIENEFSYGENEGLLSYLSVKEIGVIEDLVNKLNYDMIESAKLYKEGVGIKEQIAVIDRRLDLSPDDENVDLKNVFDELQNNIIQIKTLEDEVKGLHDKFAKLQYEEDELERELQKLRISILGSDKNKVVKMRILKTKTILEKFIEKQTSMKIKELTRMIKINYAKICEKGKAVSKVEMDMESYQIQLFGLNNEIWRKDFLSVGERQLLALSVLWSLAMVSKKDLPFVIDTPLGKIDEENRDALVDNFFRSASSQMVILSTNSEIDEYLYEKISPHVSNKYLISFDNEQQSTYLEEGYFFA